MLLSKYFFIVEYLYTKASISSILKLTKNLLRSNLLFSKFIIFIIMSYISFAKFFSSLFNKLSKLNICFSNRFKKGGSSYDTFFSFNITIILKFLFIIEKGFQRPNDIRV